MPLPRTVDAELARLERQFGAPDVVTATIPDDFDDPIR